MRCVLCSAADDVAFVVIVSIDLCDVSMSIATQRCPDIHHDFSGRHATPKDCAVVVGTLSISTRVLFCVIFLAVM